MGPLILTHKHFFLIVREAEYLARCCLWLRTLTHKMSLLGSDVNTVLGSRVREVHGLKLPCMQLTPLCKSTAFCDPETLVLRDWNTPESFGPVAYMPTLNFIQR